MARYTIHKGRHRALPPVFALWYDKKVLQRDVYFDTSCKYDIVGEDMADTNKLFGIGYFPHHHKNSVRIGWRYNPETNKIKLSAYIYDHSVLTITDLCEVPFNFKYRCRIDVVGPYYIIKVAETLNLWHVLAEVTIHKKNTIKLGYRLGLFFGGNQSAPNEMTIEMRKP